MTIKRIMNQFVILLLLVFIVFSINGAFMGAERAQVFSTRLV